MEVRLTRRSFVVGIAALAACTGDDDEADNDKVGVAAETDLDPDDADDAEPVDGFGGDVDVGTVDAVVKGIAANDGFLYVPAIRGYLVAYPGDRLAEASEVYDDATLAAMEVGLVALYQKCPHLGCRVPTCSSSRRLECPCHGSIFNRVGEYLAGPAGRGMDRFRLRVDGGRVVVETGTVLKGLPVGSITVDDPAAGPACVG